MKKLTVLGIALLITSISAYTSSPLQTNKAHSMNCPMHNVSLEVKTVMAQDQDLDKKDPDKSYDTPTHRWSPGDGCSSVDPNAPNKKRDGVKANTVGCKCVKKCINGETQEDMTKDDKDVYICSNACHKDRCSCPDPCKS